MLVGNFKVADVELPPSPVSLEKPVPAIVITVFVDNVIILIEQCEESAMNRLSILSPHRPKGLLSTPPLVPARVEITPEVLTIMRITEALLSEMKTSPLVATHTPTGFRVAEVA
jgi:hypothetical protein